VGSVTRPAREVTRGEKSQTHLSWRAMEAGESERGERARVSERKGEKGMSLLHFYLHRGRHIRQMFQKKMPTLDGHVRGGGEATYSCITRGSVVLLIVDRET